MSEHVLNIDKNRYPAVKIPTTHTELEAVLIDLLIEGVPARPFVCEGSPFNCDVVIMGINPGSKTPFWDYWSTEGGFDRAGWVAKFDDDVANLRKTTRPRIERLVRALTPRRVVELNAYPYVTANERELAPLLRDSQIFRLMLQVARPKLVFVFGKSPAAEICKLAAIPRVKQGVFTPCRYANCSFTLLYESHLSRGWSFIRVDELAEKILVHLSHAAV